MSYDKPVFRNMGDRSLLVEMGDTIDLETNQTVKALQLALAQQGIEGIVDVVPSYRSFLIVVDPYRIRLSTLQEKIRRLALHLDPSQMPEPNLYHIPVVYGAEYGPDLDWVAKYHEISPAEVVQLHTGTDFYVYMIGFTPGFAYLGELPEALLTPRKETPRTAIPGGSVGIAQNQTGIYPVESPGGWQVIGRTPKKLFDAFEWPPALLEMGDRVRFFEIQEEEMDRWRQ